MTGFGYAWRILVVAFTLAAFVPVRTADLGPAPHPAPDYAAAADRVAALQRADSDAAIGGESIALLQGHRTPRAIVLFHGLTNSPRQFRDFARDLSAQGDNVIVPRLPHHARRGGDAGDLGKIKADELRDAADQAIDIASGLGDTVVVLGLSLGGDIAAWTAQFRPEIQRAIVIAPALALTNVPSVMAGPLMNLTLRSPNYSRHQEPDTARPDRTLGWSTRGVSEMLKLGKAATRNAHNRPPAARQIFVVVNAHDHTVSRKAIDDLADEWRSTGGQVVVYEFPDSLVLPHDVVDPDQRTGNVKATHPVLKALVLGAAVPDFARRIR